VRARPWAVVERKTLRFFVWTALILGTIFGISRAFLLRVWVVPDDDPEVVASFAPSLKPGDVVVLWRATAPSFGDLVLCDDPDVPGGKVIGRLLAEPSDTIRIDGENLLLNGERSGSETACDSFVVENPTTGEEIRQLCTIETLGGHKHPIGRVAGQKNVPPPVQESVADGDVYLVSDNRLYPFDSRVYGSVPRATCRESFVFRIMGADGWSDNKRRLTGMM
jgi:signal peptidase I